jgi:hypothetical protein
MLFGEAVIIDFAGTGNYACWLEGAARVGMLSTDFPQP